MNRKLILFLICLGNITISFNTGAVAAAIPNISLDLHLPDFEVAKVVPFYMIPYGLGALLYAPLTRFVSYRKILAAAIAVYAVSNLICGFSGSLETILMAQIGAGIAAASSTPLSLMIIGDFFERDVRGRLVGAYFGCSFLASTVGMFFMGLVHWRWLFFIPAVLGVITLLAFGLLNSDLLKKKHSAHINYARAWMNQDIRRVFLFIFAMSFLYHAINKWYGVYLSREYHLDKLAVSWTLIFVALTGLLGQQIGGYLSDKKGRVKACQAGMLALSVGAILLFGHYPMVILLLILSSIAIGWTVGHNSVSTTLTDFPDKDRPIIASLNSSVRFVSGGLGFSLSKFFVEKNFSLTFLGIGCLMLILLSTLDKVFLREDR